MAKCKVGSILDDKTTTKAERKALSEALANSELWPAKDLANAVNNTRFSVGATTVKEHRRESCGCFQ
jgi:hypothetical protein